MIKYMIKGFKHMTGAHCESTSMRDVLEFIGLPLSEAMVFSLDATMGFAFFTGKSPHSLPFFIGGKQGTITKESLACRVLGVNIVEEQFQSAEKAWVRSKQLLQHNIPLLIRIEMAYLPYSSLPKGEYFGGHVMSLVGFNDTNAFLYERDIQDPISLPIELLMKARSSKQDPFFPPRNTHYILEKRPKRPPFSAACKLAIQKTVQNMLAPPTNFLGLNGMRNFVQSIASWKKILQGNLERNGKKESKAKITLQLMYGYIEEYGTGGALFRNLFGNFLEELLSNSALVSGTHPWNSNELKLIETQLSLIRESAENWTRFANLLKRSVEKGQDNCLDYLDLAELQEIGWKIFNLEEIVFNELKKLKI